MATAATFRSLFLFYFSRPAKDRVIYRAIPRYRVRRILELGVATGLRTLRMIELASRYAGADAVVYAGVDQFESRASTDSPGLTLKNAHQLLSSKGVRTRLCPGSPDTALAWAANSLGRFDLVLVSLDVEPSGMERAWFYVPRLLHRRSVVFREQWDESAGRAIFRPVRRREVEVLAAKGDREWAA